MAGLTDHRMMPDDMERPRFQIGALLPGWLADPDGGQSLIHSDRLVDPDAAQPLEHFGPTDGQTTHYALAGLAYSPVNAAEVIGRLCSAGTAYPNSR